MSLPSDMDYFTLTAQPSTKIWRVPGMPDTITAPMIYTALREPLIVAEVTVTANWEMEWDQAGLVVFTGNPPSVEDRQLYGQDPTDGRRWVRAGLEFSSGILNVSSAAALSPAGADLSSTSLANPNPCLSYLPTMQSLRIKLERLGDALWIWYQQPRARGCMTFQCPAEASAEWQKVREIAGFFWGIESKHSVWVGCYASRPMQSNPDASIQGRAGDEGNSLCVEFEDLEII